MIIENKSNYVVIEENDIISLYSYKSLICEIRNNYGYWTLSDININAMIVFGKDYKYSRTTKKHITTFLNTYFPLNNGLEKWTFSDVEHCIETGFLQCSYDGDYMGYTIHDETIRFSYDDTMK